MSRPRTETKAGPKTPPGVMVYLDFYENLKTLDDATLGALLRALMEYVSYGVVPDFQGPAAACWLFVKQYTDRDILRYQQVVERRRKAAEKRWTKESAASPPPRESAATEGAEWMKRYIKPQDAKHAK